MTRKKAINQYAQILLKELSPKDRAEQLDVMTYEDWSDEIDWKNLPQEIQNEFEAGEGIKQPHLPQYDPVLIIWLKSTLQIVINSYLEKQLNIKITEGKEIIVEACPCCGRRTIGERGDYSICKVCWWEDDGADNKYSDEYSGPNSPLTLTQARINYIKYGFYDPESTSLLEFKEDENKFALGREFKIEKEGYIIEVGTDWRRKIN